MDLARLLDLTLVELIDLLSASGPNLQIQASWGSLSAAIEMIGAGQPDCLPGPLPANCTDPPFLMGAKSTWCASHCVEREAFLSVAGRGGWHDPDMVSAVAPHRTHFPKVHSIADAVCAGTQPPAAYRKHAVLRRRKEGWHELQLADS